MQYIKTVDSSGNLVSVQSISDSNGAPNGAVPSITLSSNQSFITQAEFDALVKQIRTT